MADPVETSRRSTTINNSQATDPINQTANTRRRRTRGAQSSVDSSNVEDSYSRRRQTSRTRAFSPHNGPPRGESATMQRSTSPSDRTNDGVHYTRTGRISKAKKGLKVHQCELCGRTYSRAEHLRRHQRNHSEVSLRCHYEGCDKEFHRQDLLQRHLERHSETKNDLSRRTSLNTTVEPETPVPPAYAPVHNPPPSLSIPNPSIPVTDPLPEAHFPGALEIPQHPQQTTREQRAEKIRHYSHPPYSNRQPLAIPGEGNIITHNDIAFFNPWSPSPHYSSSSGAASPGYEYNSIPFLAPGQNSYRTRTSSNASFVEPPSWHSYPSNSRSPTSASSTMHNPWTSDQEQSPSLLGLSMTTSTSYPNPTPLSAPAMDLASFGIYTNPLKTVDERDDEERILLFPEQSFGMGSDIQRVDEYLDNYWRLFHPSFPLIHRPTFRAETVSPLLKAAMSAVGAQYCQDANARTESRTLHEKCLKILAQRELDMSNLQRLCDKQAIFLLEIVSQFRGRRASLQLSRRFSEMYDALAQDNEILFTATLDNLCAADATADDETRYNQWKEWIDVSSKHRLLLSSFILEAQQATILARNVPPPRLGGIHLPFPAATVIWDAESALEWSFLLRKTPSAFSYVYEVPTELASPYPIATLDAFQSSLLIATHYSIFTGSSTLYTHTGYPILAQLLDPSPRTQLLHLGAFLIQNTPIRALLAVSGESWILTEKVTSISAQSSLKSTLRAWIADLPGPTVSDNNTSGSNTPGDGVAPVKVVLKHAIALLRLAITLSQSKASDSNALALGTELSLYFATLVVWATVHRMALSSQGSPSIEGTASAIPATLSSTIPTISSTSFAVTISPPAPLNSPTETELMPLSLIPQAALSLLDDVEAAVDYSYLPAADAQASAVWQRGVGALMRWVKARVRGVEVSAGGMGELLDAVVRALERLQREGWDRAWF